VLDEFDEHRSYRREDRNVHGHSGQRKRGKKREKIWRLTDEDDEIFLICVHVLVRQNLDHPSFSRHLD
jgi:hypothetical protein